MCHLKCSHKLLKAPFKRSLFTKTEFFLNPIGRQPQQFSISFIQQDA